MEVFFDSENPGTEVVISPEPDGTSQEGAKPAAQPASEKEIFGTAKTMAEKAASDEPEVVDDIESAAAEAAGKKKKDDETPDEGAEKKTEDKTKGKGKAPSIKKAASSSSYSVLAKALYEEGVFTDYDDEEFNTLTEELGSPAAALVELSKRSVEAGINSYKETLTAEQKEYLEAIKEGVPHEIISQAQAHTARLESITEEDIKGNENLAKELIAADLRAVGVPDDEIVDQIKDAEALGKLEAKALRSHARLLKGLSDYKKSIIDSTKEEKAKEVQRQANILRETEERVNSITELAGQKITPKQRQAIMKALFSPVAEDKTNGVKLNIIGKKRAEDTIGFDIKLAHLILTGVFDGDITHIAKAAKSSALKDLDKLMEVNPGGFSSRSSTAQADTQGTDDIITSIKRSGFKTRQ